jgi:formate dehydrogenase iron-sulfur subunit
MSGHGFFQPQERLISNREGVLLALMAAGVLAGAYRFILGLGATTFLSDQYPWGLWIAFDVVCGVALAAGGFTTAAVVYIFCDEDCHGLVRPAVLTGFIGYVFVAIGLIADLGLPWNIWHPIIYWPKHSALFEVAWCVMLYLSVLAMEFAPAVFERLHWTRLHQLWERLVPLYVIAILTFFSFVMSRSPIWAAVVLLVISAIAVFVPRLTASRPGVPIVLIIAGVLFSTAHQSSLGTLFLLMQDKLNHLWWTPMLPVNFYLSAIAVGFAMVIFEATLSARAFKLPDEAKALKRMCFFMYWMLWIYLAAKVIDIAVRGQLPALFSWMGLLLIAELAVGVIAPLVLLSRPAMRDSGRWRFITACLVIGGLIFNRFNVTLLAMHRPGPGGYFPSLEELLVTTGLVAGIIFFYNVMVKLFPVLPGAAHPGLHPGPGEARNSAAEVD